MNNHSIWEPPKSTKAYFLKRKRVVRDHTVEETEESAVQE
jgi:hypothetical protein